MEHNDETASSDDKDMIRNATRELMPAVYARLRLLAADARRDFFGLETLNTTALVNETWLRIGRQADGIDRDRFFAFSATVMRRVLIDALRRKTADKRGAAEEVPLEEHPVPVEAADGLLALDAALDRLAVRSPRLVEVVECRFFAGYSVEETADILDLNERTVRRDWDKARAYLKRMLDEDSPLAAG